MEFKLAQSDGTFKVSGDDFAIIDAKGKVSVEVDHFWREIEINQRLVFVYEDYDWKWCGTYNLPLDDAPPSLVTFIVLGVMLIIVLIVFASQSRPSEEKFQQFLSLPGVDEANGENMLEKYVNYEAGEIKSIDKFTGVGVVETSDGNKYSINQKSVIGKGNKNLNPGDDILFQKSWDGGGKKTKNIIKVVDESEELSPYSTWLRKLAQRVKRLRKNLRFYKFSYIQSELNSCNAMLEQLNDYAARFDVKLAPHEVVLTNVIERELNSISKKAESSQDTTSWWSGVLRFVLQMLSILADFISIASPDVALLLKSVSKGVSRLLGGRNPPPSLGSGDK